MGDLSAHFSRWEFADHRTGEQRAVEPRLIEVLERLRSIKGVPLRIVSGYRSVETNRLVGGAPNSQHLYGTAADLQAGLFTFDQAMRAGAVGVGTLGDWATHVDVRPGPPVRWHY